MIRNHRLMYIGIPIVILSSAVSASAISLVPNGSFEQSQKSDLLAGLSGGTREFYGGTTQSPFEGWAFGGGWERGDYSIAISNEAHSGTHSCRITCGARGRGGIASSPINLKSGDVINISFWIKAQAATGGRIFLNLEGSPGDGWAGKDLKIGTYGWTRFSQRAVVPAAGQKPDQTVVAFIYTTCAGSVWIDDFAFEKVDASTPAELPSRERGPHPIAEPKNSRGYRVSVVSPLQKVFQDDDFAPHVNSGKIVIAAARNEYESAQLVIEAPWRPITIGDVRFSSLRGPQGAIIPASALQWESVGYIRTTVTPPYYTDRGADSYPDPLLPAGQFTVNKLSRAPIWITLKTPTRCPPGDYLGTVTVVPVGQKPTTIPLALKVWDFALPEQTHLKTLTWLGAGNIRQFYGYPWSPEGDSKQAAAVKRYQDLLLAHRLGPGGEVVANAAIGTNGSEFNEVDATLQPLIDRGMNCFIIGTAPNLKREQKTEYPPDFIHSLTARTRAFAAHLRDKGWSDKAYLYVYDEAPRSAWPEVEKIDRAIKAAAPDVRTLQCLNDPEGVKALTGYADVFDVYVAQYNRAGLAGAQKKGAEVWLADCCYPMDHPNFFIEYPTLDVRATFWLCWKHHANGFEYWSPTSWGSNEQNKGARWPAAPWTANAFGAYNGDGYLVYPGENGRPYSSIRLEALRDGLEDYEYLWALRDRLQKAVAAGRSGPAVAAARRLLTLDGLVQDSGAFNTDAAAYLNYRTRLAKAIIDLKPLN